MVRANSTGSGESTKTLRRDYLKDEEGGRDAGTGKMRNGDVGGTFVKNSPPTPDHGLYQKKAKRDEGGKGDQRGESASTQEGGLQTSRGKSRRSQNKR